MEERRQITRPAVPNEAYYIGALQTMNATNQAIQYENARLIHESTIRSVEFAQMKRDLAEALREREEALVEVTRLTRLLVENAVTRPEDGLLEAAS